MKDKVAYNWCDDEARKGENVRNCVDILMWSELSKNLEERFLRLGRLCS
jgi:hypothetical protein